MKQLTPMSVREALVYLRSKGYAVITFSRTELRGADPSEVEDRLTELGWDVIDRAATEPDEDLTD